MPEPRTVPARLREIAERLGRIVPGGWREDSNPYNDDVHALDRAADTLCALAAQIETPSEVMIEAVNAEAERYPRVVLYGTARGLIKTALAALTIESEES